MNSFGKGIKIKQSIKHPTEKEIFIDLVSTLDQCWQRTKIVEHEINIGVGNYEEPLYMTIENLFFLYYGDLIASITLWWVFERLDEDGNLLPIVINMDSGLDENGEEVFIKTPLQLWKLLQKINKN